MTDCLTIGFDYSGKKDMTCLTVARVTGKTVEPLQSVSGEEAEKLYCQLIGLGTLKKEQRTSFFERMEKQ